MANDQFKYLNKVIEFTKLEKKHKEDLFGIKKDFVSKKLELKKKHCLEKKDLHIESLEYLQKAVVIQMN